MNKPITRTRAENWPALLAEFIRERREKPFDWSGHNCALFACDWLAILTGDDPAAKYRKRCTSAIAAKRMAPDLAALAKAAFAARGWQEVASAQARRGDIATTATPGGEALGVVIGAQVAHPGPERLSFVPLASCRRAWRIG